MAWHVKKHGIGSKYEKIEDSEKLTWVINYILYFCAGYLCRNKLLAIWFMYILPALCDLVSSCVKVISVY